MKKKKYFTVALESAAPILPVIGLRLLPRRISATVRHTRIMIQIRRNLRY